MATAKRKRRTKAQIEQARKRKLSARKYYLWNMHHMTLEQYDAILAFQNGVCYICRRPFVRKLGSVDHDHKIARERCSHPPEQSCGGCWRAIVHGPCNHVMGVLRDDVEAAQRVVEVLTDPPAQRAGV